MEKEFWLVWTPNGRNPVYKHDSDDSATAEAERLALQDPGIAFYVAHVVSVSKRISVVTTTLEQQPPF